MVILNCGCGSNKIPKAINIDIEPSLKPDLICDFQKPLPFESNSVDKIYFFHVIEHLTEDRQINALANFREVLKTHGTILISYPEFVVCAANFINNHRGQREFWKRTIYGRQLHPHDFHVTLMYTPHFVDLLDQMGFDAIEHRPEPTEVYNTMVRARKKQNQPLEQEQLYRKQLFGLEK